jgi:hypothetical protein
MCNTDKKVMLINELIKLVLKRRTIIAIVSILTVILFKKPIEIYLSDKVVDGLLSKIKSDLKSDLIFLIITIWIIIYAVLRRKKYIPSKGTWFIIALLGTSYTYYRINTDVWLYTPYSLFEAIKYTDFIFVLVLLHIVLTVNYSVRFNKSRRARSKETGDKGFFVDKELTYDGEEEDPEDLLGYEGYAENVADKIGETKLERSFAIGINGKWGMGKSSFMGMIKKNLKKDDKNILIHFNPWNSKTPEAILKDFFDTLHGVIQSEYHSLSRLILRYADKLLDLNRTKSTRFIYMVTSLIFGNKPADVLYSTINNTIKKTDKRFIVFIDDLDRLDAKEIFEVLKIIRNTANFKETVFIVAYDRAYVVKALDNLNKCDSHRYLEKIFQLNIDLPYYNNDVIRTLLYNDLIEIFPEIHKEMYNVIINSKEEGIHYLNSWLRNIRDVKLFSNSLMLNGQDIIEEVSFEDFLQVQLLRFKYPEIYESLKLDIWEFVRINNSNINNHLTLIETKSRSHMSEIESNTYEIDGYVDNMNLDDKSIVKELIRRLFIIDDGKSELSVIYPDRFELYFSYTLSQSNFSEIAFIKARNNGYEELKVYSDLLMESGKIEYLKERIKRIQLFNSVSSYEDVIRNMLYIKRFEGDSLVEYRNNSDILYLQKILNLDSDNNKNKGLYSSGLHQFKKFVHDIFSVKEDSISVFRELLSFNICTNIKSPIFDVNKLLQNRIDVFTMYCRRSYKINRDTCLLFQCCTNSVLVNTNHNYRESTKKAFKELIKKDYDGFVSIIILKKRLHDDVVKYKFSNIVTILYGSFEKFEKEFVYDLTVTGEYKDEFILFHKSIKKNGYKSISFEFNKIEPSDKSYTTFVDMDYMWSFEEI